LLTLAKKLYEKGHDSKVYLTTKDGYENNTYFTRYHESTTVDDDTVVIYIDIPVGNILNAKRVVRYITYGSHWYPEYTPKEMTYYHAPFCKNNPAKRILASHYIDPCVKNLHIPRVHRSFYVVKKGCRLPGVRATLSTHNVWTQNHGFGVNHEIPLEQMVELLNQTKYFFCYDPCSFLIIMALMCGCVVVQHPMDGCTEQEWRYTVGFGDIPGIAYGYDNIPKAEASLADAPDACMKFIKSADTHIDNFIRDMETNSDELYEPCYKFNQSPYSLQHLEK
jgi:hypothetical protein